MFTVSEDERHALEAAWLAFMIPQGAGMQRVASWWREIFRRYSEPHRHYHNLSHIRDLLPLVSGDAAIAAAWFHDFVYEPARSGCGDASAQIAATALRELGFRILTIDVVVQLIRAASRQEPNGLPQQALRFLDADLSILGSPRERYAAYRDAVRREFAFLSDHEFAADRRREAERFLSRPRIYFTNTMRDRFERQARQNLQWELELT